MQPAKAEAGYAVLFGAFKGPGVSQLSCRVLNHPVRPFSAPFFFCCLFFLFMGWEQFSTTRGNGSGWAVYKPFQFERLS